MIPATLESRRTWSLILFVLFGTLWISGLLAMVAAVFLVSRIGFTIAEAIVIAAVLCGMTSMALAVLAWYSNRIVFWWLWAIPLVLVVPPLLCYRIADQFLRHGGPLNP